MNLLASFALATGLAVACVSVSKELLPTSAYGPLINRNPIDPGLTRLLPSVYFCGESVPLHEEAVARRLVSAFAHNTAQNEAIYRMRQRAAVFFPIIEPILVKHNIPLDFKYLPLVESALTGMAVSPKGAVGYWQFMPATARELGLIIEPGYDERQNLVKSTHAACRYLRYLYNRLGSWTLAAAAYNHGIGALLGNIRRQQQRDYYYLRLNAETGKYLYRILAFKELFSNYRSYRQLIPEQMMAYLSEPLNPTYESDQQEPILSESLLNTVTEKAVEAPDNDATQPTTAKPKDIPLPNAADVFRDGIRAKLVESSGARRGATWVFHLTRNGMADGKPLEEGDVLYAVVEDIDPKTDKLYLRADKMYSVTEKHTYNLSLTAIDASTGRTGIKLSDVDQIKSGWILTWKAL
ncbi:lytic transglycosylase domain-containing protein [Spirosoma panaciterrae]|uniref:lytic transglycosylase domain-containing protein n=1 Tax=Spirosoma panaciterrae TaxID=496058 RepID=UPI0003752DBD|nr:lytic transglycosylase domain-containing protein [Spirosoma panaciterrae]